MSLRLVDFGALGERELTAWAELRAANPALDSPYFHPGFARAVHRTGPAVTVALLGEGFLPLHRTARTLRPVGWPAADFQGPICAPGARLAPLRLLAEGARTLEFDHLVDSDAGFDPWVSSWSASPYIDVTGGMDGYLARASRSGRENLGQARRRRARAARELGAISFTADSTRADLLEQVMDLKSGQYAATGATDYFAAPGRRALLRALLAERDPDFAGVLSTLHAGPHLLAAHFGIRSHGVLHWWFPVYDPAHARYAPGWLLLRELIAAAPALGLTRIDLGRGDDEYKRRAKTGETRVGQGLIARSSLRLAAGRGAESLLAALRSSRRLRQAVRWWRVRR